MSETPFNLQQLDRQVGGMIRLGKICDTDYPKGLAKVMIDGAPSGWLPMMTARAGNDRVWHPYEDGEQVVVFSPSGNPTNGVIMGAAFTDAHAANGNSPDIHRTDYGNGSFVEHNRATGALTINTTGDINIIAGGNVKINGARIDLN